MVKENEVSDSSVDKLTLESLGLENKKTEKSSPPSTPPQPMEEEACSNTPTTAPSSYRGKQPEVVVLNNTASAKKMRPPMPLSTALSVTSSTWSVTSNAYSAAGHDRIDENLEGLVIEEEEDDDDDEEDDEDITIASEIKSKSNRSYSSRRIIRSEEDEYEPISGYINTTTNTTTTPVRFVADTSCVSSPPLEQPSTPKQGPANTNNTNSRRSRNPYPSPREDNNSSALLAASAMKKAISELKDHVDRRLTEMREQNRRNFDRVLTTLQHESLKRSALDGRLHQQLLLQSETMVAMEVKLLRLEAKVERREAAQRQRERRIPSFGSLSGHGVGAVAAGGSDLRTGGGGGGNIGGTPSAGGRILVGGTTNTIDEEDDLEEMEIQVTTRNSLTHRRSGLSSNSRGPNGALPTAVVSSGASLASGVTATSFLEGIEGDAHVDNDTIDNPDVRSEDGDVEDEGDGGGDGHDGSASTPTQGPGRHFSGLESILMNPIYSSTPSEQGISTRAVRGDMDCNSSLATSVTSATLTSTIVTATTRGGDSINPRGSQQFNAEDEEEDDRVVHHQMDISSPRGRPDDTAMLGLQPLAESAGDQPRSRSQSPLTVQSTAATSIEPQSVASASLTGSILSTAAVAPARSFRARRDAAARTGYQVGGTTNNTSNNTTGSEHNRPLANRIVSFTTNEIFNAAPPPEINEATDSITMPDELDNLSDVADVFADRARSWREEYESRLDAISKRFGAE